MSPLCIANSLAQTSSDGGAFAAFGALWLVFAVLGLALTAFWVWMLVDLLGSSLPTNEKLLWAVVMLVVPVIGSILYFVMKRGKGPAV